MNGSYVGVFIVYFLSSFFKMLKRSIKPSTLFVILFFFCSCALLNREELILEKNLFSGSKVSFAFLDIKYMRTKNFNKIWSKVYANKFYPYRKLLNKEFEILGQSKINGINYFIIQDNKDKLFKSELAIDSVGNIINPNYILLEEDYMKAKDLINKYIWLNYLSNENIFFTYDTKKFSRFQKVKVVDVMKFQNSDKKLPLWLIIESIEGDKGFLRYDRSVNNIGYQDHYFVEDPLSEKWDEKTISLIRSGRSILGMTKRQVRISIFNPEIINHTSSRHGISEQWVYKFENSKKQYYQFEGGKLTFINK